MRPSSTGILPSWLRQQQCGKSRPMGWEMESQAHPLPLGGRVLSIAHRGLSTELAVICQPNLSRISLGAPMCGNWRTVCQSRAGSMSGMLRRRRGWLSTGPRTRRGKTVPLIDEVSDSKEPRRSGRESQGSSCVILMPPGEVDQLVEDPRCIGPGGTFVRRHLLLGHCLALPYQKLHDARRIPCRYRPSITCLVPVERARTISTCPIRFDCVCRGKRWTSLSYLSSWPRSGRSLGTPPNGLRHG